MQDKSTNHTVQVAVNATLTETKQESMLKQPATVQARLQSTRVWVLITANFFLIFLLLLLFVLTQTLQVIPFILLIFLNLLLGALTFFLFRTGRSIGRYLTFQDPMDLQNAFRAQRLFLIFATVLFAPLVVWVVVVFFMKM